jgi:hypothetical protein
LCAEDKMAGHKYSLYLMNWSNRFIFRKTMKLYFPFMIVTNGCYCLEWTYFLYCVRYILDHKALVYMISSQMDQEFVWRNFTVNSVSIYKLTWCAEYLQSSSRTAGRSTSTYCKGLHTYPPRLQHTKFSHLMSSYIVLTRAQLWRIWKSDEFRVVLFIKFIVSLMIS